MTRLYEYQLIDVFSDELFCGNQLAVFTDAQGLDTPTMQRIASELRYAETTFVFPSATSQTHYTVRIFTPTTELKMGEQSTIGTAFALHHVKNLKNTNRLVFQESVGPVSVTLLSPLMTMRYPSPEFGPAPVDIDAIVGTLSLDHADVFPGSPIEAVSCGVPHTIVPVRDTDALRRIEFRDDIWSRTLGRSAASNVMAFTLAVPPGLSARARVFSPALGVRESAASGAAGCALGAYLLRHQLVRQATDPHYVISQGDEMGRPSRIHVFADETGRTIRVGGQCVWAGRGEIRAR